MFALGGLMNRPFLAILASLSLTLAQPVFAQVQSDSLANDLKPINGALITQDQINQINASISKIQHASEQPTSPEVVGAPDYKVARASLEFAISDAITNYLQSMDQINDQVTQTLQKLASLANQTGPLRDKLLQNEINRLIPIANDSINQIYASALKGLYLTDSITVKMDGPTYRNWVTNPVKQFSAENPRPGDRCVTGACKLQIAQDLNEWFSFVGTLNQTITILNYSTNTMLTSRSTSPFITQAFLTAFKKLTTGPKPNVSYDLGGYMVQLLKTSSGSMSGTSVVPAFIFKKAEKLAVKISKTPLSLALNAIDAYSTDEIIQAVNRQQEDAASKLPAVLYGDEVQQYTDVVTGKTLSVGQSYRALNGSYYFMMSDHHACVATPAQLKQWSGDPSGQLIVEELDPSYTVEGACTALGAYALTDGRVIWASGKSYCHIQGGDLLKFTERVSKDELSSEQLNSLQNYGDCWRGNYRTPNGAVNHIVDSGHYCHIATPEDLRHRFGGDYTDVPSMQNLISTGDCR